MKIYVLTFILFLVIDFFWLAVISPKIYKEQIGFLLADQVRLAPAVCFYLLYIAGMCYFVIFPGLKFPLKEVFLSGAFFGLVCYATYDLTNLATLKGWPVKIVLIDLVWGAFITGIVSVLIVRYHSLVG